jgi:hypothetical protein
MNRKNHQEHGEQDSKQGQLALNFSANSKQHFAREMG